MKFSDKSNFSNDEAPYLNKKKHAYNYEIKKNIIFDESTLPQTHHYSTESSDFQLNKSLLVKITLGKHHPQFVKCDCNANQFVPMLVVMQMLPFE